MKAFIALMNFVAEVYATKLIPVIWFIALYIRNLFVTGGLKLVSGYASYRVMKFFEVWDRIPDWLLIPSITIGIIWMFVAALPPVSRWIIATALKFHARIAKKAVS